MITYKPYGVIAMVSGGDDSMMLKYVLDELGIEVDFIMHGVTGTGIQETTDFVREIVANSGTRYLEANAKDAYLKYVMRKGFFGKGNDAHAKSYHVLKAQPFRTAVSHNIRHGKRGRYVLFLNGVRVDESENRADKLGDKIFNLDPAMKKNVWVNILHWVTTKERDRYLADNSLKRSPVATVMGCSGECWCGTTQSMATALQAAELFPKWGERWRETRKQVIKRFPWDWGQNITKYEKLERAGQQNVRFNEDTLVFKKDEPFMPMCHGCKARMKKNMFNPDQQIITF